MLYFADMSILPEGQEYQQWCQHYTIASMRIFALSAAVQCSLSHLIELSTLLRHLFK
jgi:hypothetical protein